MFSRPDIARNGTYAEYIAVKATELAEKPASLDWQHAAGVPLAALTAWQVLYEDAQLQEGDKVLIQAGSGGVGQFAIQLAKLRGAKVYTTTSAKNAALVRDLGADEVIDYTQDSYTRLRDLDVVLDTLGGEVQANSWQCLREGGKLVSIIEPPSEDVANQHKAKGIFRFVEPNGKQLAEIAKLFDDKKLSVHVNKVFPLAEANEAQLYSETHRAAGKIILQVI